MRNFSANKMNRMETTGAGAIAPSGMDELKRQNIWLCWRYETRGDKRTKVPSAAGGGATGTSEDYAATWVDYATARSAARARGCDGVGFRIPEGYFFLDIDHRSADDPYVRELLERFSSYTERSVSGNGIHIYGKCDISRLPTRTDKDGRLRLDGAYYMKNPHNDTELYCGGITNRFAVYTGDIIHDAALEDCTEALLETLEKNMRREEPHGAAGLLTADSAITAVTAISPAAIAAGAGQTRANAAAENRGAADIAVVSGLGSQKNGDKFHRLYANGDISQYGSHSEADCALCAMIAFRTGPDPAAIDSVFRASALYREKWEREDYRNATIEAGIRACRGNFRVQRTEHPYFIRFRKTTAEPYVSVPLLAKYAREHMRYILVRDDGRQGLLKYVYEDGCYRLYSNDMLMGVIKGYIADYDEELVKMRNVTEALQHITTDLRYVSQNELNADESLINFRNGLLRVTADELTLLPHSPDVYSTIQIPCDWTDEPEPTPVFDAYMNTLTDSRRDVKRLLLEYMGACFSNVKGWRMKKALFLVGEGDTGKSQLKSLTERILGKGNFAGIDLKEIEARFGTGTIYGTRLAGSSDMSFLSVEELKTFKMITGGDSLHAEFKGQQAFEFTYNGLLWFCMNRLPKFGGDNGRWVYDRLMVVDCPNVIPREEQDKRLLDKMYAERAGIVHKAIKALQTVIANDCRFSEPQSVEHARERYMAENSTVISFFEECAEPLKDGRINTHCTTGRVFQVYQAWCRDNNNGYARTAKEFREELAKYLGGTWADITRRYNGNTYYKYFVLSLETRKQYQGVYGYDGTNGAETDPED